MTTPIKSPFPFQKKGRRHMKLKISTQTYQKLLDGNEVSFYQRSQASTIKVRILNTATSEPKESVVTPCKKNKSKRPKRRKAEAIIARDEDISSKIRDNTEDNERKSESQPLVVDVLHENVICADFPILTSDVHQKPFIFSSVRQSKKIFKAR
ncbi:hypothetical protein RND81_01G017100 [Saponaria officinalis]|uniref:Uncharacterized protein n=1 Tax=Saponaria officinalis TaxID=3572 RepID=A0AAW1NC81_SAPOF